MSKGNLFFGMGSGKLGDIVLYRGAGQQIARARNRKPKNPQSGYQMLQRSVMKTTSLAYSLMAPICDHSFQGQQEGTPNQSRFTKLNSELLRAQLGDIFAAGIPEQVFSSKKTNYAGKYNTMPVINPYQVSEGSLPGVEINRVGLTLRLFPLSIAEGDAVTYQQVADALGLQQGDQLTFLFAYTDDTEGGANGVFSSFEYARVILSPAGGNMGVGFVAGDGWAEVMNANDANEGTVYFQYNGESVNIQPKATLAQFYGGLKRSLAAYAVIVSRLDNGTWKRSSETLHLISNTGTTSTGLLHDAQVFPMGTAATSWLTGADSSLYLNQAK